MRSALKIMWCLVAMMSFSTLNAQRPEEVKTEATDPEKELFVKPLDDVVDKKLIREKHVMPYDVVREADVFWQKKIWRIIDVREKMNLPFSYPEEPFVKILLDAATKGDIKAYSTGDDKFSKSYAVEELTSMLSSSDTIRTMDPETYEEKIKVVHNDINPEDIKQFRVKEIWFFDKETSTLNVRILGIAPLKDVNDTNGNFRYVQPLFWAYYPDCREMLGRHKVFNMAGNDAAPMTWEDLLEMRYFSSYIIKESNVYDRRIEDYSQGVDGLLEGEKIKADIFNFEHDLWSY